MEILNIDELGFKIQNEEKITHSLSTDKIAKKAILVEKERISVLIEKLIQKEVQSKITRDISLSTNELQHLSANKIIRELKLKVDKNEQLDEQEDEIWLLNQKYLFSQEEKEELAAIKSEQVQNSITGSEKCNACLKKQSEHPDEEFKRLTGYKIHESIPSSPTLCLSCYEMYLPYIQKAKKASQKLVFCIHCNNELKDIKTPLLSEFKDKFAIRSLCMSCYLKGLRFEECSICYGKKAAIYTSEHGLICLIHGYLLKYNLKTQDETDVVNIGAEQFD